MKIRYFLYLFLIAGIYYSCNGNNQVINTTSIDSSDSDTIAQNSILNLEWEFDSIFVDKKFHVENDTTKLGVSVNIFFKFPVTSPADANLSDVQKTLFRIFAGDESKASTPKEVFDEVLKKNTADAYEYLKDFDDNPTFSLNYDINTGNAIDLISKDILTTSVGLYAYTGGAHGNYYIRYYNINTHNGVIINEKELFKDVYKDKLASLIQNKVKEMNDSPDEGQHIALLVEIPEIEPNDNFYFSADGLVYVYNQYEISPYAQGIPEVTLSYEEVSPLIKEHYQYILENIIKK